MYIIKAYTFLFSISFLLSFNNSEIIKNDFKIFMNSSSSDSINLDKKNSKNIFLGTALSAIIPGAGQMYNKDYKRGYAYLSIELLSWVYRKNYISKSESYEKKYKNFANDHWSFQKWISDYCLFANPNHPVHHTMINNETGFFYPWDDSHHIEFYINEELQQTNASNGSNWFQNTFMDECLEAFNNNQSCNTDYFIDIDVIKNHHFYEGLGKYELFFPGWDDTHNCEELSNDENCSFVLSSGNTDNAFTFNKKYYQYQLRYKANKKSDYAENALTIIFLNHAVSMFDAFISNVIENNEFNFNYYSNPIYNNYSNELNGINISILW